MPTTKAMIDRIAETADIPRDLVDEEVGKVLDDVVRRLRALGSQGLEYAEGTAWAVWVREGYEPDGVWFPLVHTIRNTRSEAIEVWRQWLPTDPPVRGWNWEAYRRRGVVRAARILVEPALPSIDFPNG